MKKIKKHKRIFVCTLALTLLFSSFNFGGQTVHAENGASPPVPVSSGTEKKNMQLGAGVIENPRVPTSQNDFWSGDYVYYGNYFQTDINGIKKDPIKWSILNKINDNLLLNTQNSMNVLSWNFRSQRDNQSYEKSQVRDFLINDFLYNAFIGSEEKHISETTISNSVSEITLSVNGGNEGAFSSVNIYTGELNKDKIFLLNGFDLLNPNYGFWNTSGVSNTRKFYMTSYTYGGNIKEKEVLSAGWLRSVLKNNGSGGTRAVALTTIQNGTVTSFVAESVNDFFPAMNLDTTKVLFTSLATNGKSQEILGSKAPVAPTVNAEQGYSEWVLTMKDPDQTLSIDNANVRAGANTMTIPYTNATTGTNQYISVMITDNAGNELLNYGKLAQTDPSGSGTVTLTLPAGFDRDTMKIFLMSEQDNGDYQTSFASAIPVEVPVVNVHYDTMGGTMSEPADIVGTHGMLIPNPTPTFTDHEFKGWYTSPTYEANSKFDFNTPINADTTLYAKWFPDVYALTFHANGGTGNMNSILHNGTEGIDLPANTFERTGYEFIGWSTNSDGTGDAFTDKQLGYVAGRKPVTLYAQWKEKEYTVKYNTDGGTAMADKTGVKFTDDNLYGATPPTKDGYTFLGWEYNKQPINETTAYNTLVPNDTVMEITLVAKWSQHKYSVKYETGFEDINIADKTNVKWNDSSLLPETPKKDGYGFIGWELNGKQVESTDEYSSLTSDQTDGSFITLTAKWVELTDYSVLYNANGGSMTRRIDATITGMKYQDIVPTPIPVREGYTFLNWTYKEKAVKENSTYASLAQDSSLKQMELVAQWAINKHTVTYEFVTNSPDGIKPPSGVIVEYGSKTAETTVVVPTDWEFDGWYADKECTQKFDFETAINSDISLYGKWAYKGKPAEPVEPSQPNKPSTDNTNSPSVNTGDTTNSVMYVITLMVSMLGLLAFAVKKHEKKKVDK